MTGAVLVLAGSDPLGYSGLQADLRHLAHAGVEARGVPTALTLQSVDGVEAVTAVAGAHVERAIQLALLDGPVGAVKIGLVTERGVMEAIASSLHAAARPVVLDPVLAASAGTAFHATETRRALMDVLFPLATLLTPNLPELAALSGCAVSTPGEVALAVQQLLRHAPHLAVLVKAGHARGSRVTDRLFHDGGVEEFHAPRREGVMPRGTGCMLSTLAAAGLARGLPLVPALEHAHAEVQQALRTALANGERRLAP